MILSARRGAGYYYNARWYDAKLGRFAQADTVVPDAIFPSFFDRYAYGKNNPLIYSDPSGHFPWPVILAIGGAVIIGAAIGVSLVPNLLPWDPPTMATERVSEPIISKDVTSWLSNQLVSNAQSDVVGKIKSNLASGNPINMDAAMQAWTSLVGTGASWDFKVDLEAAGLQDVTIGGYTLNYDAIANIHFGFVGRAAGFDGNFLIASAGFAQQMRAFETGNPDDQGTCNTTSYCDHPFATWSVKFGIYLYELFKDIIDALDEEALARTLREYIRLYGEPPPPPPGSVK